MGGLLNGAIPDHPRPLTSKLGGRKDTLQISTNQLEVVENVNRTNFRTHWLVVKRCNRTAFAKATNE